MATKRTLHIVSHTHWDREWYFGFEKFRRRLVKMMDRLLDLLVRQPAFCSFLLDGQFLIVEDYLRIRPENEETLRRLVSEGRLLIGPWYTQPTETISSGEALVRNLMLGIQKCREYGGLLRTCYLPDEFGHVSQLPQICRGFGMTDAAAWRGLPRNAPGAFIWRGSDGSEILMHYINSGYGDAMALPNRREDHCENIAGVPFHRDGLDRRFDSILQTRGSRATTENVLLLNGVDHAFAQEDLPEIIELIHESYPGLDVVHSSLDRYTAAVRQTHSVEGIPYHCVNGELLDHAESSILVDVHSMRADLKQWNRLVEDLFEKWMEPFAAYAWLAGLSYPSSEIDLAWRYLLENQTHDTIDCSSVDCVYRSAISRYEQAMELGEDIAGESLLYLCNRMSGTTSQTGVKKLTVFNPLGWERSGVILATLDIPAAWGMERFRLMDNGNMVCHVTRAVNRQTILRYHPFRGHPAFIEVLRFELAMLVNGIPANGYKTLEIVPVDDCEPTSAGFVCGNRMDNKILQVTFNPDGTFDLLDKRAEARYEGLHWFEDSGEAGNGFEHEPPLKDMVFKSLGNAAKIECIEDSPLRAVFRVSQSMMLPDSVKLDRKGRSHILVPCRLISDVSLEADSPRVDIRTTICNQAGDHRLRVCFPTGIKAQMCHVDQPYDVVSRPLAKPDMTLDWAEQPRDVRPHLSFVDISDGTCGFMVANRGLCEYEVSDDASHCVFLTLLRCTDRLYGGEHSIVMEERLPAAQCIGQYSFEYSLIPHQGCWENGFRHAYEFRHPVRAVLKMPMEEETLPWFRGYPDGERLPAAGSFVHIEGPGIIVTAVKKHTCRETLILRLLNLSDKPTTGRIILPFSVAEVFRCTLGEERIEALTMTSDGIMIKLGHKEIYTMEILKY